MITQENIQAEIKNGKLIITVDVSPTIVKNAGMSGSGKNKLLATSRGNLRVNGGPSYLPEVVIGLNVFCKP